MTLEQYLQDNGILYQTKYINGHKLVKIGKNIDIFLYKDSMTIYRGNICYDLPPKQSSYEYIKRLLDDECNQ